MDLTVDDITRLAALVSRERLDSLEYGGLRITKTMHSADAPKAVAKPSHDEDDDDILFHSSDT